MAGMTPGPWAWFGNATNHVIHLATKHNGRRYVMGFQRWGMRGAQPMFQPGGRGLVPATDLFTFEVGNKTVRGVGQAKSDGSVYRLDIDGIDCADARAIAEVPAMFEALKEWLQYIDGAPAEIETEAAREQKMLDDMRAIINRIEGGE